jgi:hypothetical protein
MVPWFLQEMMLLHPPGYSIQPVYVVEHDPLFRAMILHDIEPD